MHGASLLNCADVQLNCNHRSGHLKTEHTESLFLLRRHLGNWPRSPAVSMSERTAGSSWETQTVAAADGVRFARVRWEINFLLIPETAPFICKHSVYPSQHFPFGAAFVCQAGNVWTLLHMYRGSCTVTTKFWIFTSRHGVTSRKILIVTDATVEASCLYKWYKSTDWKKLGSSVAAIPLNIINIQNKARTG